MEAATKTAVSVAMSKPPTERLQVRMERGKRADSPHPFPKATATQSKKASAAAGAPPASSSGTDLQSGNDPGAVDTGIGTLQNVRPTGQLTHTTQGQSTDSFPAEALRERMVFQMDGNSVLGNADLIDQRIKQNVSQGMQDLSVDLQKQTKDIASVNAQVAAMRDDLNKKFNVTGSVNDIKNSINEFNSQVHNYSVDLCATKNDMSSVLTSIQQSESDIKMVKTSMLGIQRDTTLLKSDTHHLKSQHNAIRLDNEALKNDTISSTSEIQAVHAAVGLIKTDVQGQGAILSNVKANVDTLRHDMLAFKGQLDLADTKITGLKATLSRIEESVNLIKAAMMVAIPQSTPITVGEVEIKSDVEEPHESSVPALSSTPIEQENSEGIVGPSQNTSVVSFKPRPGEKTYEKHVKPDNLDDTEPECSAGAESSSLLAKDVGPVDKQTPAFFSTEMSSQQDAGQEDSQETQDPTHGRPDRYVADTGEYSESCGWPDSMAATQGTENTERELPTDTASQPEDSGDTMVNIYTGRDAQGRVHIAGQLPQHVVERFTRSRGRDCAKKTK